MRSFDGSSTGLVVMRDGPIWPAKLSFLVMVRGLPMNSSTFRLKIKILVRKVRS